MTLSGHHRNNETQSDELTDIFSALHPGIELSSKNWTTTENANTRDAGTLCLLDAHPKSISPCRDSKHTHNGCSRSSSEHRPSPSPITSPTTSGTGTKSMPPRGRDSDNKPNTTREHRERRCLLQRNMTNPCKPCMYE
jgi:hypothetical protein